MTEIIKGLLESMLQKESAIFVMFIILVTWIMWTNDKREHRYINTIDNLASSYGSLDGRVSKIEENVQDIKTAVFRSKI